MNRIRWTETSGPTVIVRCQHCGELGTGRTLQRVEKIYLLDLVPVFGKTTTYVICNRCDTQYLSSLTLGELERQQGNDVAPFLNKSTSLIATVMAASAILIFWWPGVGLVWAGIAVATTWKARSWVRTTSQAALALSVLIHLALAILFLITSL